MTKTGVVYATTGPGYQILARRAARTLRQIEPELAIDLYTDSDLSDPAFNQVHRLQNNSVRPKMEALRRSRFDRTLYLDADTIALAPLSNLFTTLNRFDIALCAEQRRADYVNNQTFAGLPPVPHGFPIMNSGVIALRKSVQTKALLTAWEQAVHTQRQTFDQPSLRALLYHGDLRLLTLPPEYNAMFLAPFLAEREGHCAPRLLHAPALNKRDDPGDPLIPLAAAEAYDPGIVSDLHRLLTQDPTIDRFVLAQGSVETPRPPRPTLRRRIRRMLRRPI